MADDSSAPVLAEAVDTTLELEGLNLKQLSVLINQQSASAEAATVAVLEYATRAGIGLMRARDLVMEAGESWTRWMDENLSFHRRTAYRYITIARGRDRLPDGPITLTEALDLLSGVAAYRDESEWTAYPKAVKASALQMHADGISMTEIGETLGVVRETVRRWVDPNTHDRMIKANRQRRRKAAAAKKALAEKERREDRDRLARSTGGDPAKAYAEVRRLAATLDRALADVPQSAKPTLAEALRHTHRAEDAIVEAMNAMRGKQ